MIGKGWSGLYVAQLLESLYGKQLLAGVSLLITHIIIRIWLRLFPLQGNTLYTLAARLPITHGHSPFIHFALVKYKNTRDILFPRQRWPLLHFTLHHRADIYRASIQCVIDHAEHQNRARHQNTVVHGRSGHWSRRGPEAEEQDHGRVDASYCVDRDAQNARGSERAPRELDMARSVHAFGARFDEAGAAPPEKKRAGEEVSRVEAVDGEGDDIVESDRGAYVDEPEEAGDRRGQDDAG